MFAKYSEVEHDKTLIIMIICLFVIQVTMNSRCSEKNQILTKRQINMNKTIIFNEPPQRQTGNWLLAPVLRLMYTLSIGDYLTLGTRSGMVTGPLIDMQTTFVVSVGGSGGSKPICSEDCLSWFLIMGENGPDAL